jgi:MFS family permease
MGWLDLSIYLWLLVGVGISAILPGVWAYVRTQFPTGSEAKGLTESYWTIAKPYLALCLASALTSLLLVAFLGDTLVDPRAAILAGYAWDSTLQKLR